MGWDGIDVLIVSGDAYVDHPTFGAALIGRWLVAHGYRVGIAAQPDWHDISSIMRLGRPRLFAGITAGALDSMLAHYTAFKNAPRRRRLYAGRRNGPAAGPGHHRLHQPGAPRPSGACRWLSAASRPRLRRAVHYDFWSNKLRRSILPDSKADALVYGMGEQATLEIARRLENLGNEPPAKVLWGIRGVAVMGPPDSTPAFAEVEELPSFEEINSDPAKLMQATLIMERQVHQAKAWAVQPTGNRAVLMAPPAPPLSTAEMDQLYGLPFARRQHPLLQPAGPGPGDGHRLHHQPPGLRRRMQLLLPGPASGPDSAFAVRRIHHRRGPGPGPGAGLAGDRSAMWADPAPICGAPCAPATGHRASGPAA